LDSAAAPTVEMIFFSNVQDSSTLFDSRESAFARSVNPLLLDDALD
jgi:hypothetical protein